ncbi:MAG: MMPL family transporter [Gammaproteobacteria bacterium]|nr:MMPL family transporter [Gammaproteobacteria bacterium]
MNSPKAPKRQWAKQYAERLLSARWIVVLVTVALVIVASLGVLRLGFEADYKIFFDEDNPQLIALETLEQTYGKSENVAFLIVPDDGNATSENALSAIVWLTDEAWKTPYSRRVDSLANFQYTTADGDDLYVRNLIERDEISRPQAQAHVRSIALSDPRIEGSMLARNGDVTVVNVTVELPDLSGTDLLKPVAEVANFARDLAEKTEERFSNLDIRVVGTIMVNQTFVAASLDSQLIFFPASLLLMALILGVLTRGMSGVFATGMVMVFSVLAAMGIGGWFGLPFSPPLMPVPTIVLMIVVANCVHLLVTTQNRMRAGDSKHDAIVESIRLNLHPVFLASLTTTLGFLSMNFSEVPPYRHLGMFVAFGIMVSFVLSVTFLPAVLSILPFGARKQNQTSRTFSVKRLADVVLRYRKVLFCVWLIIVPAMILAITRNDLNDVLVHFFNKSVEFRQDTDFMDERLSGNTLLEYSLEATTVGGATNPNFLQDVENFAEWYRNQPAVRHVSTITDTFKQLNKSMHGDDPAMYQIPDSQELAAQYLLLYELSLPQGLDLNNQIDRSRTATRVSVSAETLNSKDLLEINTRAETWLQENAPHVSGVSGTGPSTLFAYIGQRNIQTMLIGTVIVLLAISAILLVALRSLRIGLVSIVPNLTPAILGFGVWGLTVGQVGLALSVVVAMTIGIVVDDTVHFLGKYLRARRELNFGPEAAVRYSFDTAGRALLTTTFVLVAGFLIFVFSPFVPTAQVGILTALIIGFALVADLTLLPALLLWVDSDSKSVRK